MSLTKLFGFGCFAYYSYDLFYDVYKYSFIKPPNHLNTYGNDSYVLVTGASEGIGKEFAENLASQGFNIILLSRNVDKLNLIAEDLSNRLKVKTLVYPLDLAKANESDFKTLAEATAELDVSVLINNAGMVKYKQNNEMCYEEIDEIMNLNGLAATRLIHYFLPRLAKRENKSAIINVSSVIAVKPCPVLCLYSSTKAFTHYFTVGLSENYKNKVDIMSFMPANVETNMAISETSPLLITPQLAVQECLKDLGYKIVSHGYWKHTLVAYITDLLPQRIRLSAFSYFLNEDIKKLNSKTS